MKKNQKIGIFLLSISFFLIPLFLNNFIFGNNYISKVSNDGWASFFGSYIGGAIGGIGTLVAMYITLKQTQKQIYDTEEKDKKREQRHEANEIVNLVAEYLSHVNVYFDDKNNYISKKDKIIQDENKYLNYLKVWGEKYNSSNFSYTEYLRELDKQHLDCQYASSFFYKRDNKNYEQNKIYIYKEYEETLNENIVQCNKIKEDLDYYIQNSREKNVIGCTSFWMLEIKLANVNEGKKLLNLILKLHEIAKLEIAKLCFNRDKEVNTIISEIEKETYLFYNMLCKK